MVLLLGIAGVVFGLYLLRNRIPGPWRRKGVIDEGGVAPRESAPTESEGPQPDDGQPAGRIEVA